MQRTLLFIGLALGTHQASAEKQSGARQACKSACDCLTRVEQLRNYLQNALKTARNNIESDSKLETNALIAAAAAPKEQKAVLRPIAAVAHAAAKNYREQVAASAQTVEEHLVLLATISHAYDALNHKTEKAKVVQVAGGAANNFHSAAITDNSVTTTTRTVCPQEEPSDTYEVSELDFDKEQAIDFPTEFINFEARCHNTGDNSGCTVTSTDVFEVTAQRAFAKGQAETATAGNHAAKRTGYIATRPSKASKDAIQKRHKPASNAAAQLLRHSDIKNYNTYINNPEFLKLVYATTEEGQNNPVFPTDLETKLKAILESRYGPTDGSKFDQKVWQQIDSVPTTFFEAKSAKQTTISKLAGGEQYSAALGLALAKKESRNAHCATTPSQTGDKEKSQCTDINDKTECGNKNGCKYNETTSKCEEDSAKTAATAESTSKCSKHTKKDDCKSPDCKWEAETCRDSSFLVNKKLDLVADAFVGFIDF
uniref:Variant surface glycoprotein n=1 Tax=Trypanosoma brucei TaxID=5691 RepID=A0A1V0FXX3_9TRYP|nr:variant surface glycoprotein [Trypanosoma brucei]